MNEGSLWNWYQLTIIEVLIFDIHDTICILSSTWHVKIRIIWTGSGWNALNDNWYNIRVYPKFKRKIYNTVGQIWLIQCFVPWVNNSLGHQFGVSFPPFLVLIVLLPYRDWGAEHWGAVHWDQIEEHTNWHYSGMTNMN